MTTVMSGLNLETFLAPNATLMTLGQSYGLKKFIIEISPVQHIDLAGGIVRSSGVCIYKYETHFIQSLVYNGLLSVCVSVDLLLVEYWRFYQGLSSPNFKDKSSKLIFF